MSEPWREGFEKHCKENGIFNPVPSQIDFAAGFTAHSQLPELLAVLEAASILDAGDLDEWPEGIWDRLAYALKSYREKMGT